MSAWLHASCLFNLHKLIGVLPCSYNTYNSHYKEVQCFQDQVEPLLYKYGVNFVFFGEPRLPQTFVFTRHHLRLMHALFLSTSPS